MFLARAVDCKVAANCSYGSAAISRLYDRPGRITGAIGRVHQAIGRRKQRAWVTLASPRTGLKRINGNAIKDDGHKVANCLAAAKYRC